jgi:superfamily I DNA/RNA helicase
MLQLDYMTFARMKFWECGFVPIAVGLKNRQSGTLPCLNIMALRPPLTIPKPGGYNLIVASKKPWVKKEKPVQGSKFGDCFPVTEQGQNALNLFLQGTSVNVDATAGAAKSTLIKNALVQMKNSGINMASVLVVMFNRVNADEMTAYCPEATTVGTWHSMGYSLLRKELPYGSKMEPFKYTKLAEALMYPDGKTDKTELEKVVKAWQMLQINCLEPTPENLQFVYNNYNVEPTPHTEIVCGHFYDNYRDLLKQHDYTDMIYGPWRLKLAPATKFDYVIVDEVQDVSNAALNLIISFSH